MTSVRRTFVSCLLILALGCVMQSAPEPSVSLTEGELTVKVTRNGKLSNAEIRVLAAGGTQEIVAGRTEHHESTNPKVFRVATGAYDVVIKSTEMAGRPEHRIEGIRVEAGGRHEMTHEFMSGTLRLGAIRDGELLDATTKVVDIESGKPVGHGRTYDLERSNPRVYQLAPGSYRLTIDPLPKDVLDTKTFDVTILVGATVEHMVDFSR